MKLQMYIHVLHYTKIDKETQNNYGAKRFGSLGKNDARRMFGRPKNNMTTRSNPTPQSPWLPRSLGTDLTPPVHSRCMSPSAPRSVLSHQVPRLNSSGASSPTRAPSRPHHQTWPLRFTKVVLLRSYPCSLSFRLDIPPGPTLDP